MNAKDQLSLHFNLPSPETLAVIAANFAKGVNLPPAAAVDYASSLWVESCRKLYEMRLIHECYDSAARASADFPRPDKFPAKLDEFLRRVVCAKTPSDSTKRFRDFLRYRVERSYRPEHLKEAAEELGKKEIERRMDNEVDLNMTRYQKRGILYEASWLSLVGDYRNWWASQKSNSARTSAMKQKRNRPS
jgi:hypothetical protein